MTELRYYHSRHTGYVFTWPPRLRQIAPAWWNEIDGLDALVILDDQRRDAA